MMSKETIKQGIDMLFRMYDENKDNTMINHHTRGIIIDFIGGEPFMNVATMHYGCEYFINECIRRDHQWLNHFRFNISSNGILYFEPDVQKFIKQFNPFLSLGITIDGPKNLHDICRKDYYGNGSFDRAILAFRDARDTYHMYPNTKITIAPENLPYLNEIFDFFIQEGCDTINANPIHEHLWTPEEGKLYYYQLKKLADVLLCNHNITSSLFLEACGIPLTSIENQNWCGGTGKMLAFDTDGLAYPCIRYMKSSLGSDQPPIVVGSVNGVYQTEEEKTLYKSLNAITRRSQSTNECFNCQIAAGCGWCSAWNYQQNGSCNIRSTNICWMHRARSLVNSYYCNNYYRQIQSLQRMPVYLNREIATQMISNDEYDELLCLSTVNPGDDIWR